MLRHLRLSSSVLRPVFAEKADSCNTAIISTPSPGARETARTNF